MDRKELFNRMKLFPKVDLHRHLEGSISPETLVAVAQKHGGKLPAYDVESLRPHIQMQYALPGFRNFLEKFKVYRGFYSCREAIQEVAYAAVKEAAEDNVKYLELRYSPSHFAGRGRFEEPDVVDWIHGAITRAAVDYDIIVIPILTISRDYGLELAENTVSFAVELPPGRFYGLDIAGDEITNSARQFEGVFKKARDAGLRLTIHAGEACGAYNVREAVTEYQASRIGHGVRSAEDDRVMALLREKNIPLEICLTSNVHTGIISRVQDHPIKKLMGCGVPVCINTDDPAISGITLSGEYVLAIEELGFTEEDLKDLNRRALDFSFHPDKEALKAKLLRFWS